MLQALGGTLVMLAVGLIEVGAQVLAGRHGRSRGEDGGQPALSPGRLRGHAEGLAAAVPSAAVAAGRVCDQIHQRVLEMVFVQGHALQQVVEELRRHRGVDAGAAGHEHVHLVHALNVAGCKPLVGFPVKRLCFCGMERREVMQPNQSNQRGVTRDPSPEVRIPWV